MSRTTRYAGKDLYASWTTATGTTTLTGDQRTLTWNRNKQWVDNTAGADAATSQKYLRAADTVAMTIAAHSDGTSEWDTELAPGKAGTLVWSTGAGTADAYPKYTCEAQVLDGAVTEDYANMTEWSINWECLADPTKGAWTSGA
jgi:hypothetical protein